MIKTIYKIHSSTTVFIYPHNTNTENLDLYLTFQNHMHASRNIYYTQIPQSKVWHKFISTYNT